MSFGKLGARGGFGSLGGKGGQLPPAGFEFVYEDGVLVTEDGQPVYERI